MTQSDPVARILGYVLAPPIRFIGRRLERRVQRALPEPPWWLFPVVVSGGVLSWLLVEAVDELRSGASRSERAEPSAPPEGPAGPEPTAERCPDPSDGEPAEAVVQALEVLEMEVPPEPDEGEVRARYRSLAVETHPDQGGDAEEFIEVKEAWETLREREELSGNQTERGGN